MNEPSGTEPSKTSYFLVFLLITALIFAAVGVSLADLGPKAVFANLIIAGAQACLLGYFFMHLKGAEPLTWLIVGAGLFWLAIMFTLLLTDYLTRHIAAY